MMYDNINNKFKFVRYSPKTNNCIFTNDLTVEEINRKYNYGINIEIFDINIDGSVYYEYTPLLTCFVDLKGYNNILKMKHKTFPIMESIPIIGKNFGDIDKWRYTFTVKFSRPYCIKGVYEEYFNSFVNKIIDNYKLFNIELTRENLVHDTTIKEFFRQNNEEELYFKEDLPYYIEEYTRTKFMTKYNGISFY